MLKLQTILDAPILQWPVGCKDANDFLLQNPDPDEFKHELAKLTAVAIAEKEEEDLAALDGLSKPVISEVSEPVISDVSKPPSWSDSGNAERMVSLHGNVIRYLHDKRQWVIWDGSCWKKDRTMAIHLLAKETVLAMYREVAETKDHIDREKFCKFIVSSESRSHLDNMIALAAREPPASTTSDLFDKRVHLFNCPNGTIDLDATDPALFFRAARQEDLLTQQCPIIYDPSMLCPQFDKYISKIMPNVATRVFLQKSLGYSLSGRTTEKMMWLLIGEKHSGKTTLVELLRYIFGEDYAANMDFNSLRAREGHGPSGDIARLEGIRFATACESEIGQKLSSSVVKRMTGGDTITAARKYQDEREYKPSHKIFMMSNYEPNFPADDPALWDRIAKVPFTVTIPEEMRDLQLGEKLKSEASGILNWIVDGFKLYKQEGLKKPAEVVMATNEYRASLDNIPDFLRDCYLPVVPGGAVAVESHKSSAVYQRYKAWFSATQSYDDKPIAQNRLSQSLTDLGYAITHTSKGNVIHIGKLIVDGYNNQQPNEELPFEKGE